MPGRYAVVIGINYRNFPATMDQEVQSRAGINALNYAEADAEEMAKQLSADGYDVVKLVGSGATRAAIINALRTQSRNAGPEGLLLVHYSGHGALDPDDRELAYLLPADADPQEMSISAIALNDIPTRRLLGQTRSALVLLDCCHSGYAVDFKSGDKDIMLNSEAQAFSQQAGLTFRGVSGRVIIAACGGQQLARERQDLQHGVLTYYVLRHWRNNTKSVNDINLYEYLAEHMRPQQGVPDPVRGGSAQQGVIELRPARAKSDHTRPTQSSEPDASAARLGPRDRATLFNLISGIVKTQTHLRHLYYLVDLKFKANSRNADLEIMIRRFIRQAEAANLIPELREAIDQFRADRQANEQTPSEGANNVNSTLDAQGDTSELSASEPGITRETATHVQQGKDYFEKRLYVQALTEYNQAIELDPQLARAYDGRGDVYYEQNDYKRALAEYNRAIELDPQFARAYYNSGFVYYMQKKYKLALANFNQAIKLDPQFARAYNGRGYTYYMQKKYKLALADFSQAIKLDPQFARAYNGRGDVYYEQNDYEQALIDYNRAIELDPQLARAYYNRGFVYYDQEKYKLALADFSQAIKLDPTYVSAYNSRGDVYYEQNDYEQALIDYNRAIELDPQRARVYYNRGFVYYDQEKYKLALADFSQAIKLDPIFVDAYKARGDVYYEQNDYKWALVDYNRAIELNPDLTEIYSRLAHVYTILAQDK
jgi:tetratricopeptide (TPR) repeat protein